MSKGGEKSGKIAQNRTYEAAEGAADDGEPQNVGVMAVVRASDGGYRDISESEL